MEEQAPYTVNTGLNTTAPAEEVNSATAMSAGGWQATKPKANGTPQAIQPKQKKNMGDGKQGTPPSVPLKIPRNRMNLLTPILNEALEAYVAPDSMISWSTETAKVNRDAGFWLLVRLPPIQTDPPPSAGKTYRLK